MRLWIPLLMLLAVGCEGNSSGKLAQPYDDRKPPPAEKAVEKPAQTDPTAEAILTAGLAAHSGGSPDRLSVLKSHSFVRRGKTEQNDRMVENELNVSAVWPDDYRAEFRIPARGDRPYVMALRGTTGWHFNEAEGWDRPRPFSTDEANSMAADVYAEWMMLLVPLVELKDRVAAVVPSDTVSGKPTRGVRVWAPNRIPIDLLFETGTDRLVGVKYTVTEFGGLVKKAFNVYSHTNKNGVLVPNKIDYTTSTRPRFQYPITEYEVSKSIPKERFEKP
jgi:hypothetical protein